MLKRNLVRVAICIAGLAFGFNLPGGIAWGQINIGVSGPFSGGSAILGEYLNQGYAIALEEVPKSWGKTVKLIKEDDAGDPGKAIAVVTKLLTKDNVPVLLGPHHSGCGLAVMPTVDKYNIAWFSGTLSPKLTEKGSKSYFRARSSDANYTRAIAMFAVNTLKVAKIGVMNDSSEYGVSGADAFVINLAKLGQKPVIREVYHEGDRDFTAQLSKIKAAGIDALYLHGLEVSFGLIVKQARSLGITIPMIGTSAFGTPKYIQVAEGAAENTYFTNTFLATEPTQKVESFVKRWRTKYKGDPEAHCAAGYDEYKMAAQAMELAGANASREKIRDAARKMTYEGLQGTLQV